MVVLTIWYILGKRAARTVDTIPVLSAHVNIRTAPNIVKLSILAEDEPRALLLIKTIFDETLKKSDALNPVSRNFESLVLYICSRNWTTW